MKMKGQYISCAVAVSRVAKKYKCNPNWLWDLLEDEFNVIKGHGHLLTSLEFETFWLIVSDMKKSGEIINY